MSKNIIHIKPLNPYVQDDGENAWLCIDKKWFMMADNRGGYVNIPMDEVMAVDLNFQTSQFQKLRVKR